MNEFDQKLRDYQELFGLQNWTISLLTSDTLKQNAMTYADPNYNRATITINNNILDKPAYFDELIIHELIHIVMALYDYFADNLGQEGSDKLFFIARENSVSQLTKIMLRVKDERN